MKFHFNKFERVAGVFVVVAFVSFGLAMISVAVKQGWFDAKIEFTTVFESAEGVHPGTLVQIAGLKAGSVVDVKLMPDNRIEIHFYVFEKFEERIRQDSQVMLIRPFVIGERVLDVSAGSLEKEKVAGGNSLPSIESTDLMTLMSGKKLGQYLATMSEMVENLRFLATAMFNRERTESFVKMFDTVEPLLKNLNVMSVEVIKLSKQATKDEKVGHVLGELAVTTKELNMLLPQFKESAPKLAEDMTQLVSNLSELTTEFKVVVPALQAIAPDLPRVSKRAVEALDEAVVLMKSMEKSFLIRGNAREVREEENKNREPASH